MPQSSQSDHYSPGFGMDGQMRVYEDPHVTNKRKKKKKNSNLTEEKVKCEPRNQGARLIIRLL